MYRLGVEDGGEHSLLDYPTIVESARVLECIARSLNAVVVERIMIQGEVAVDRDGSVYKTDKDFLSVSEPSVFGMEGENEPQNSKKRSSSDVSQRTSIPAQQLTKNPGFFTRAEVRRDFIEVTKNRFARTFDLSIANLHEKVKIKRVETHLLDESPVSLSDMIASSLLCGETNGTLDSDKSPVGASSQTLNCKSEGGESRAKKDSFTIQETLSARNIRVAVVGNVDAGKCFGCW